MNIDNSLLVKDWGRLRKAYRLCADKVSTYGRLNYNTI
jgi:hypothetical protein